MLKKRTIHFAGSSFGETRSPISRNIPAVRSNALLGALFAHLTRGTVYTHLSSCGALNYFHNAQWGKRVEEIQPPARGSGSCGLECSGVIRCVLEVRNNCPAAGFKHTYDLPARPVSCFAARNVVNAEVREDYIEASVR